MAIPETNLFPHQLSQRNAFNRILQYANKYRLLEGLKEQMLAHMQLKFNTAELQQQVSDDFIAQLVKLFVWFYFLFLF